MSESRSSSVSWTRNATLWVQVATLLHCADVSDRIITNVRTELYNPRLLRSVEISASADGFRVARWILRIDWKRHVALLQTKRLVVKNRGFIEDRTSYALHVTVQLIEEYFVSNPGHGRGWTFSAGIEFSAACGRIDVGKGKALQDHPRLIREDSLVIPGLEEASIEVFGLQ